MRRTFFALLVWMIAAAAECRAQGLTGPNGLPVLPMVTVDEAELPPYPEVSFNRAAWDDAKACLIEQKLISPTLADTMPFRVRVVPFAATIRVHDMTADSVERANDSTSMGIGFEPPTDAYTLLHSRTVLATTNAASSFRVMRHEAIHILLWRDHKAMGHPREAFGPCDLERPAPEP